MWLDALVDELTYVPLDRVCVHENEQTVIIPDDALAALFNLA